MRGDARCMWCLISTLQEGEGLLMISRVIVAAEKCIGNTIEIRC